MTSDFNGSLERMFSEAPPEIQAQLRVGSGFRSVERQAQLWADALVKYGSPEAARKWVAPPGNSQHNMGNAADLKYLDPAAKAWAHQNASRYGLAFPLGNEPWHIELASARGGSQQPASMPSGNALASNPAAPQAAPQNALAAPPARDPGFQLQSAGLTAADFANKPRNALAPMPITYQRFV
jgi:hypothetical protein